MRSISGAIVSGINNRPSFAWLPLASVALASLVLASCGGKTSTSASADANAGAGANPAGGDASSTGGAGSNGGSAGDSESVASAGGCPLPKPAAPSSPNEPPSAVGCYVYSGGAWQQTQCNCDLWLKNTLGGPVSVKLALLFSPANMAPSLTGSPDVELKLEDVHGSWFNVWAEQAKRDASFSVVNEGGFTIVRLGASIVNLDPVWLAGCESRSPIGRVSAPYGTPLDLLMQATLTDADGSSVGHDIGECSQSESHPTFMSGGSGGESSDAGPAE